MQIIFDYTRFLNSWTLEKLEAAKQICSTYTPPFPTIVRFCPKLDVGSGHPIKQKDPFK